jgi:nucleoside 2-deoxyribosyltransferase
MKVYIATRFTHKEEFHRLRVLLESAGHTITHDWTTDDVRAVPEEDKRAYMEECAVKCMVGIFHADALIMIARPGMKGAFFEFGFAVARSIPVIVIDAWKLPGEPAIFFHLPVCGAFAHANSFEEAIALLPKKTLIPQYDGSQVVTINGSAIQ